MLYTSYFAKGSKGWADNVIPVAICAKPPEGYAGACYKKLAPPWELVKEWKSDPRNDDYFGIKRKQYDAAVLNELDVHQVVRELQGLMPKTKQWLMGEPVWESKRYHIVLLCYEKPSDFCHRHFVAQWLTKNGYNCEEV